MKSAEYHMLLSIGLLTLLTLAAAVPIQFVIPGSESTQLRRMVHDLQPHFAHYPTSLVRVQYINDEAEPILLLYHLSSVHYGYLLSRVWYDKVTDAANVQHLIIRYIVSPYKATQGMYNYGLPPLRTPKCPDNSTQYVAGTACQMFPSAANYTLANYLLAYNQGLSSVMLIGNLATRQNYMDYLSCPQLGGFNNIGHGDPDGILVADGMITADDLATLNFRNLTTVVFNSCEVMNPPLSTTMAANGARFYTGGQTELIIGSSEPVTYCFWNAAFQELNMTDSLTNCATIDPVDTWASEDPSGDQEFSP